MCCLLLDGVDCIAYYQHESRFNKESNITVTAAYICAPPHPPCIYISLLNSSYLLISVLSKYNIQYILHIYIISYKLLYRGL